MTPTTNFIGQRCTVVSGLYAGLAGTIVGYVPAGVQHVWRPMFERPMYAVALDRAISLMFFADELETEGEPE